MTDLFREVDEALREDRAKAIWQRYGVAFVAAAVVIVAAVAAYVGWQNYQRNRDARETAELLAAVGRSADDPAAAADALAGVAAEGGAGPAVLARLHEGGLRAEQGDTDAAVAIFRGLAADASADRTWRDLATLLAALHTVDTADPVALRAELAPLATPESPWRYTAQELSGLLALREDDRAAAAEIFAQLAADDGAPQGVRSRAADLSALLKE